jgi:uncharacterized protein GlcG (DUF336 family)
MTTHISSHTITHETAARAVAATLQIARESGITAVAAVVDPGLNPVSFGRADGAPPHSAETSRRKACTSASTRRPTGWMGPGLDIGLALGTGTLLTNVLGGVPIVFDGVHVGGLGVAGGTPAQDADIARHVLAMIGADPAAELS